MGCFLVYLGKLVLANLDVESERIIQTWLGNVVLAHSNNKSTPYQYKKSLQRFCEYVGKTPQKIVREYEASKDERNLKRAYAHSIMDFQAHLSGKGYANNTIIAIIIAVRSFFKYNDLSLGHIISVRSRTMYHNRDITREEVRQILGASKPRDRAFFCMMVQTGLRPDTLCKLQMRDIEPDFSNCVVPCKVDVPEEKAKGQYRGYFTFMGEESIKYLKSYFQGERPGIGLDDLLFTAYGGRKPASPKTMSLTFAKILRTLQVNNVLQYRRSTNRKPSELRLYTLRKFFRKYARGAGFEFMEFWMGHIVKEGVDDSYRPSDVEYHRKLYKDKAMPSLRIETPALDETEKIIAEQSESIKQLNEKIARLEKKYRLVEEFYKRELTDEELAHMHDEF